MALFGPEAGTSWGKFCRLGVCHRRTIRRSLPIVALAFLDWRPAYIIRVQTSNKNLSYNLLYLGAVRPYEEAPYPPCGNGVHHTEVAADLLPTIVGRVRLPDFVSFRLGAVEVKSVRVFIVQNDWAEAVFRAPCALASTDCAPAAVARVAASKVRHALVSMMVTYCMAGLLGLGIGNETG